MANHKIVIEGIDKDGNLILSDKGKQKVKPGDTVTWEIKKGSGVASIISIVEKSNSKSNVFEPDPAPVVITGTINKDILKGKKGKNPVVKENYSIIFTTTENPGNQLCFDPTIQVNN